MLIPRLIVGCNPAFEISILEDAKRHSLRLGKIMIDASNASWNHNELMREYRLAYGQAKLDTLMRLGSLNNSYNIAFGC